MNRKPGLSPRVLAWIAGALVIEAVVVAWWLLS